MYNLWFAIFIILDAWSFVEVENLLMAYSVSLFLTLIQVDSLAISRDSEMHEATRRILSVLLRQVKPEFHFTLFLKTSFLSCMSHVRFLRIGRKELIPFWSYIYNQHLCQTLLQRIHFLSINMGSKIHIILSDGKQLSRH